MQPHGEHDKGKAYRNFAIEMAIDFTIMHFVMYTMIDTVAHLYLNINNVYMTLMMVAPMALLMNETERSSHRTTLSNHRFRNRSAFKCGRWRTEPTCTLPTAKTDVENSCLPALQYENQLGRRPPLERDREGNAEANQNNDERCPVSPFTPGRPLWVS